MKHIIIKSCNSCPFYKEENNVYRNGTVGYLSTCSVQDNKEIEFTDKMDVPELYSKIHESCNLDNL